DALPISVRHEPIVVPPDCPRRFSLLSAATCRKRSHLNCGALAAAFPGTLPVWRNLSKQSNQAKRAGLGNRGLILYNRAGFSRTKAMTIPSAKPRLYRMRPRLPSPARFYTIAPGLAERRP